MMMDMAIKVLKRKWTWAYVLVSVFGFVILSENLWLASFFAALAMTLTTSLSIETIRTEEALIEKDVELDESIEEDKPTPNIEKYTIGNYRFQVKEFVNKFNKAKTQRDWDNVLTLGETIVEGIKVLESHSTYSEGARFHSSLEIVRLVAFLRVYIGNKFCLGSDIRKVMKLEVDTYRDKIIGIKTNPNTFVQIEARAIRNQYKNKFQQQQAVDKFCFERTYKKRLGRIA